MPEYDKNVKGEYSSKSFKTNSDEISVIVQFYYDYFLNVSKRVICLLTTPKISGKIYNKFFFACSNMPLILNLPRGSWFSFPNKVLSQT